MLNDKPLIKRQITVNDVNMYFLLQHLKELSTCIDKQVACILTDKDYNILSVGINTIINCDRNCLDKQFRICNVIHAEAKAISLLNQDNLDSVYYAYINLFPCPTCQKLLDPIVTEIISFGPIHKQQVSNKLVVFNDPIEKINNKNTVSEPYKGEVIQLYYDKMNQKIDSDFYKHNAVRRYKTLRRLF